MRDANQTKALVVVAVARHVVVAVRHARVDGDRGAERRKVLWVTHRLDLLDQVHEEIRESVWQICLGS